MSLPRKLLAEFLGTFVLVFGGCGSAVLAAKFGDANLGIAFAGVSLAFGLTVLTMAYAVGHISGGHFNPAVTLGLVAAGRANPLDAGPYILAQVAGAVAAVRVYPPTIRRARTCQARRAATSRACQPGVCGSTSTSSPSSHTAISARSLTGAKTADLVPITIRREPSRICKWVR